VQHLRPRGAHASALAGCEHDRKASPIDHCAQTIQFLRLVLSEPAVVEKPDGKRNSSQIYRWPRQEDKILLILMK
jgi:hypothetical protein